MNPAVTMATHSSTLAWKIPWAEKPGRLQSTGLRRVGHDFTFTFTFHFLALEKEMATHSSVLAWRIPGTGEPGGLPSMGLPRVGHDWSDSSSSNMDKTWLLRLCDNVIRVCLSLDCPNKMPQTCQQHRFHFSELWRLKVHDHVCWPGWFLMRARFWVVNSSPHVHCHMMEKKSKLAL